MPEIESVGYLVMVLYQLELDGVSFGLGKDLTWATYPLLDTHAVLATMRGHRMAFLNDLQYQVRREFDHVVLSISVSDVTVPPE